MALISLGILIVLLNRLFNVCIRYEKYTGSHGEGEVLITNAEQDKY